MTLPRLGVALPRKAPDRAVSSLDSRLVLLEAISLTQRSKYAFAKAAGLTPQALNRYLLPTGSQMTAAKLGKALAANGIVFQLALAFASAAPTSAVARPPAMVERAEVQSAARSKKQPKAAPADAFNLGNAKPVRARGSASHTLSSGARAP